MGLVFRSSLSLAFLVCAFSTCLCLGDDDNTTTDDADTKVNPRWLQKLDALDRSLLDELIGYAPPAFTDELTWHESTPLKWDQLAGKVVVVQSWTNKSSASRGRPVATRRILKKFADNKNKNISGVIILINVTAKLLYSGLTNY